MRVYVIPTEETPFHLETPGDLHDLQALVGGYIEPVYLPEMEEMGILLLANEMGLLEQEPVNQNMEPYFFVGQMVALSTKGEEFVSLDDAQLHYLRLWFHNK